VNTIYKINKCHLCERCTPICTQTMIIRKMCPSLAVPTAAAAPVTERTTLSPPLGGSIGSHKKTDRALASANTIVWAAKDAASRASAKVLRQYHTLAATEAGMAARDAALRAYATAKDAALRA